MPKVSKHPRLRVHIRRGNNGRVYTYYYYDMRPEGERDILLGKDLDAALARWSELHEGRAAKAGTLQEAFDRFRSESLPAYSSAVTRRNYAASLRKLELWCGRMAWADVTLPVMVEYLRRRTGKRQANHEMSVLSVVWGKARLWGMTAAPFPAYNLRGWKNKEEAPAVQVSDKAFEAVYRHASQLIRDAMDLSTATALRLTDCRHIEFDDDWKLTVSSSKTRKPVLINARKSVVLTSLMTRRAEVRAAHSLVLCTPSGKRASERMLTDGWSRARAAAIKEAALAGDEELFEELKTLMLRFMRKRAAGLAGSVDKARKLLQHNSEATTRRHYYGAAEEIEPTR